jgi:hypothetical protein
MNPIVEIKMKNILIGFLFLVSGVASATGLDSPKDTRALSDKIIGHFVKTEFQEGLNIAKQYWPLPEVEIDGLANKISTQWPIVDQRFGKPTGYEFIKEEKIGHSFVRYYYLHKFQNHAIYWRLTFYKPVDTWVVNGITFLDSLDQLFE